MTVYPSGMERGFTPRLKEHLEGYCSTVNEDNAFGIARVYNGYGVFDISRNRNPPLGSFNILDEIHKPTHFDMSATDFFYKGNRDRHYIRNAYHDKDHYDSFASMFKDEVFFISHLGPWTFVPAFIDKADYALWKMLCTTANSSPLFVEDSRRSRPLGSGGDYVFIMSKYHALL